MSDSQNKDQLVTPVQRLKKALDKLILRKAMQMENIAAGIAVPDPINPKDWDSALKIIEKMPNLDLYDKGDFQVQPESKKAEVADDTENPFEASSRKIKDQLNGNTTSKTSTT